MTEPAKNCSHFTEPADLHMAALAHIVIPGAPHHVTQRGNRRANSIVSPEFIIQNAGVEKMIKSVYGFDTYVKRQKK